MIVGYMKCFCDFCFGMFKKKFCRLEVNGIDEFEIVVENFVKCNIVV